jgi:hypothetical protein
MIQLDESNAGFDGGDAGQHRGRDGVWLGRGKARGSKKIRTDERKGLELEPNGEVRCIKATALQSSIWIRLSTLSGIERHVIAESV